MTSAVFILLAGALIGLWNLADVDRLLSRGGMDVMLLTIG